MTSSAPGTPNACATFEPLIDLILDGALEQDRAAGLNDHLRSCARCRLVKRDLLRLRQLTGDIESPEFDSEIVSRVKETLFEGTRSEPVHPAHPRRKRRSVPWANAGISAAMLLIGMFFAYGAYRFGRIHESNVQGPALVDQAPEHAALKDSLGNTTNKKIETKSISTMPEGGLITETKPPQENPEPLQKKTPLLQEALNTVRAEMNEEDDSSDLFGEEIPTEDVVLSSKAKEVLESCDTMARVRREVSARMPVIEGGILHATPLVMNLKETTLDLEGLLTKGLLIPGNDFVIPEDMNMVFEIQGEGVHLRIEVDQLKDKAPRVNIIDLKKPKSRKMTSAKKPAIKKLKLR